MDWLLYTFGRALLALIQITPLDWVAHIGRWLGGIAYVLDARHRKVAIKNLTMCLGAEYPPEEIRRLAKENFKRIGECFATAGKTLTMSTEALAGRIEITNRTEINHACERTDSSSIVVAIGHFGNFEVLAQVARSYPTHRGTTTYRALREKGLNRLISEVRKRSHCLYFERRSEGAAMRTALRDGKIILGLLSDQHSGDSGVRIPFLGHDCNTTKAPAVLAQRFNLPLFAAVCYRTKLAHWRLDWSNPIATHENGQPRSAEAIMGEVNRFFEAAVKRDPANWFWVHNRWKPGRQRPVPTKAESAINGGSADEAVDTATE